MSRANQPQMQIGCPECDGTVSASLPPGTDADVLDWDDPNRLRGTETACRNCGHELDVYFY